VTTLWCVLCGVGYASLGEVPAVCPECNQETRWNTSPPYQPPRAHYVLSYNDRRFLRSLGIQTD
jgi:hypothetical protein